MNEVKIERVISRLLGAGREVRLRAAVFSETVNEGVYGGVSSLRARVATSVIARFEKDDRSSYPAGGYLEAARVLVIITSALAHGAAGVLTVLPDALGLLTVPRPPLGLGAIPLPPAMRGLMSGHLTTGVKLAWQLPPEPRVWATSGAVTSVGKSDRRRPSGQAAGNRAA